MFKSISLYFIDPFLCNFVQPKTSNKDILEEWQSSMMSTIHITQLWPVTFLGLCLTPQNLYITKLINPLYSL